MHKNTNKIVNSMNVVNEEEFSNVNIKFTHKQL
jgi:hypothetical protein